MRIHQQCPCGAEIELSGLFPWPRHWYTDWVEAHKGCRPDQAEEPRHLDIVPGNVGVSPDAMGFGGRHG